MPQKSTVIIEVVIKLNIKFYQLLK